MVLDRDYPKLPDAAADRYEAAVLLPSLMCLFTAMVGWPLIPDWITSILLPEFRNSLVCSSIDLEVSTAAGCFLLAGALMGLRTMLF